MGKIPKHELDANQLEFGRHAAAVLCSALSQGGMDLGDVDDIMGEDGFTKKFICDLLDGSYKVGYPATDMLYAMGVKMRLQLSPIPPKETEDQ